MKLRPTTTASHPIQFEFEQPPFKTSELLTEVRASLFPHLKVDVAVGYSRFDTVAHIQKESEQSWLININAVLNHRDTPIEVIRYILTHELLHIEVRPRLMTEAEWKEHRAPAA